MLVTRPDHDETTNYLFFWSNFLIDQGKQVGRTVIDLAKRKANAQELFSRLKKLTPKLLVFNGHGDDQSVTGYDNQPLVSIKKNLGLLKDKIVYSRSCSSAKKLGPASIKSGCKAYIGYNEDFVFMTDSTKVTRPLNDSIAKLFLEPSNYVVTSLLKGHSSGGSNFRSKEKYRRQIQILMLSNSLTVDKQLIPLLVWDYHHQICLGDSNARL